MWGILKKAIELKVSSIAVLAVIAAVAAFLLFEGKVNTAARYGGYLCIAIFGLLAIYLVIYNHVKELFDSMLGHERAGNKELIKNYKDLAREHKRTDIAKERVTQASISGSGTAANTGSTFKDYREVGSSTETGEQS